MLRKCGNKNILIFKTAIKYMWGALTQFCHITPMACHFIHNTIGVQQIYTKRSIATNEFSAKKNAPQNCWPRDKWHTPQPTDSSSSQRKKSLTASLWYISTKLTIPICLRGRKCFAWRNRNTSRRSDCKEMENFLVGARNENKYAFC